MEGPDAGCIAFVPSGISALPGDPEAEAAHEAGACDDGLAGCDRYSRNFLHGIFESEDLRRDAGRRKMAGGNVPVGDDADRGIFYNPTGSFPAAVTAALVYSDVYRR